MITPTWPSASSFGSIGGIMSYTTANRPTNPTLNQIINDTTLGILIYCASTSPIIWNNMGGVQV